MQPVVVRSWYKGLLFQEGRKEIIIWQHEFEKADWERIKADIGGKI